MRFEESPRAIARPKTMLLRELSERLYEQNFDPKPLDSRNGMKLAISEFQTKSNMTATGEATEGLLMRLRKLNDIKPWGSIIYRPENDKYGISWDYPTRREAVAAPGPIAKQQIARRSSASTERNAGPLRFLQIMVADPAGYDSKG